jgi:hypothetical protein
MSEFRTDVIKPIECFKEGWELIKDQYWLFFAITLVGMLIGGVVPAGLAIGAMFCGIYYCLFEKLAGRKVEFEGLFKGFNYFVPGLVASLIVIVPAIISVVFLYGSLIAVVVTSTDSHGRIGPSLLSGLIMTLFVEGLAISLIIGCLHAFLMFAYPLIVERGMGGWEAFRLSARAVWANLKGVVGLIFIEFILGILGYLCLAVGVYFVMPVMFAGVLVAYRKVFPPGYTPEYNAAPQPAAYAEAVNWQNV